MIVLRLLLVIGSLLLSTSLAAASYLADGPPISHTPLEKYILPPQRPMRMSMDILVDGRPVRVISHEGRLYLPVPGMGAEYEIRVNNHGSRRITAIVSVDGLSVIKGMPASEANPGYIVDPYGQIVIKGWRRDRDTVAAFTFEPAERSYAARRGYPEHVGVIGLVAFEEEDWGPRPLLKEQAKPEAKRAAADLGGTGTGWGRDIDSRVYQVPFVRSANKRTVTIYYDTAANLRRAGVPVDSGYPMPFPVEPEYCPRRDRERSLARPRLAGPVAAITTAQM